MMIEYLSIVDYNTLETISEEKGYVSIENINELTYQKTKSTVIRGENVEHFNYYIIVKSDDNKAYCINKCENETGNPEWSLYCANIYMNYLRAYIDKEIPSLPSIHDLYILIASTSSCFEPKDILTPKYLNRLKEYLSKANFSESINSIIDVLKSPNFDYHIIQ